VSSALLTLPDFLLQLPLLFLFAFAVFEMISLRKNQSTSIITLEIKIAAGDQ